MAEQTAIHAQLAAGRWQTLSLLEQLGNVGSEVGRAIRAQSAGDPERMWSALSRALELIDLTCADPKHVGRLKELRRAREVVCDSLVGENRYCSTPEGLDRYFGQFALAARLSR